ncbi:tripartite tricarboxylate transporter TctB family protein [Robertmurraya kyonggiensis]|uniref:Tripartite tricarboxylate transporter TctB family protein n=1 Tax=Robertmurraya kyonggiensis TaxID=1037680 RepID=A0A4U1D928_9BACI|nr:tripartite tricarboxylate transporter TctB family protein [Robertmurraya kyonggiensis]TKC18017.1 tripartite tricarboxylate transporter TctB family protein [Robertmurraya kyonggiensis]
MTEIKNKLTGVLGSLFGIFYIILSFSIKEPHGMTMDLLGSKTFPIVAGVIILLSSLLIFFHNKVEDGEEEFGRYEIKMILPFVLIIIIYIALLPLLGTIISTIFFMSLVMNRMNKGVWWKNIVISTSITIVFWLLFVILLKVPLPTGLLGVI